MKRVFAVLVAAVMVLSLASHGGMGAHSASAAEKPVLIGFAESNMDHPFRIKQVEENRAYAEKTWPGKYEFIVTNAGGEVTKQVTDIEDLIAADVDVLLLSPLSEDGLNTVLQSALDKGVKVVTLDSRVSIPVSLHVGGSDELIGNLAAEVLNRMLGGKGAIAEIMGTAGTSATIYRNSGFRDKLPGYPGLSVVTEQYCNYNGPDAMTFAEDVLTRFGPGELNAIYAHSDIMAMAAIQAIEAAGRQDEGILVIGVDGMNDAIDLVVTGDLAGTITYPYCAPEGMIYLDKMLSGENLGKEIVLDSAVITAENAGTWVGKGT